MFLYNEFFRETLSKYNVCFLFHFERIVRIKESVRDSDPTWNFLRIRILKRIHTIILVSKNWQVWINIRFWVIYDMHRIEYLNCIEFTILFPGNHHILNFFQCLGKAKVVCPTFSTMLRIWIQNSIICSDLKTDPDPLIFTNPDPVQF